MNQQRSRRFRASKEIAEKVLTIANVRESLQARGAYIPSEKDKGEHFDSNCITPVMFISHGFTFMRFTNSVVNLIGHTLHASIVSMPPLLRPR